MQRMWHTGEDAALQCGGSAGAFCIAADFWCGIRNGRYSAAKQTTIQHDPCESATRRRHVRSCTGGHSGCCTVQPGHMTGASAGARARALRFVYSGPIPLFVDPLAGHAISGLLPRPLDQARWGPARQDRSQ